MYKLSKYNICLPLEDPDKKWLLLNGCSGAFRIISQQVAQTLMLAEKDFRAIHSLDIPTLDLLRDAGCLIGVDSDEEKTIDRICQKIHQHSVNDLNVTFIPSYVCNFQCPYCFERSIKTEKPGWYQGKMTADLVDGIFKALDDLLAQGKRVCSFTLFGGEPLLPQNKEIIGIILEKCRAYHAPILAVTNGYHLDEYVNLLKDYPIDTLKITIDGTRDIHDQRRAPANGKSFDRIMRNVITALEQGIAVSLRTNINKENIACIDGLKAYYEACRLTKFPKFSYYFKATMACFEPEDNAVSDLQIMDIVGNDCSHYCRNSAFNRIYVPLRKMLSGETATCFKAEYCGAHSGNLVFDPYGNIFSCWDVLTDPRSVIGKVNTETGRFVFNENYHIWQNRTVSTIPFCKNCKYKLFCGGGCAAQGLVVNDDMNKPFCEAFIQRFNQVAIKTATDLLTSNNIRR